MNLLIGSLLLLISTFPPAKDVPQKPSHNYDNIKTNWGVISHDRVNNKLIITGHHLWVAEGYIRPDNKIYFLWTKLPNGEQAVSIYVSPSFELNNQPIDRLTETEITKLKKNVGFNIIFDGRWGYEDTTTVDDDGNITGSNVHEDHFWPVK